MVTGADCRTSLMPKNSNEWAKMQQPDSIQNKITSTKMTYRGRWRDSWVWPGPGGCSLRKTEGGATKASDGGQTSRDY